MTVEEPVARRRVDAGFASGPGPLSRAEEAGAAGVADGAAPDPSPSIDRGRRNVQLDVMRGVAILLVMGRHLELQDPDGPLGPLAWTWHRIGWIGVDLFFVLSGFLIGGLLLGELGRHGRVDVPRFLVRRGLKLYPPYYVFIMGVVLIATAEAFVQGGDGFTTLREQLGFYWPNLLFLHTYVGQSPAGHTWSLAVEEHFYLLLPFVIVLLAARGRVRWLLGLAAAAVPVVLLARAVSIWMDNRYAFGMAATHLRLDGLLFGVGLRALAEYRPDHFAAARRFRWPLVAAGCLLWAPNLVLDPDTAVVRTVGLTATFLGAAAFLLAAFHTHSADFGRLAPPARRVAALLARIGIYSYAIYLWHVNVIGWTEQRLATRVVSVTGSWNSLAWAVTATVVTALAVVFGLVATKVVDWPALRFRERYFPSRSESLPAGVGPDGAEAAPRKARS